MKLKRVFCISLSREKMSCELERVAVERMGEDKGQKFKIVMSVLKMKNEFCLEVAVRLELNLYRGKRKAATRPIEHV